MQRSKNVESYVLDTKIGEGSFGKVWRAVNQIDNEVYALKLIAKSRLKNNDKNYANLETEILIMRDYNHPNVVKLVETNITKGHICLVLEYCAGGNLANYIQKSSAKRLSGRVSLSFFVQLVAGLRFLHHHSIIHRDIAPKNILLSESSPDAIIKIADFGMAKILAPYTMAETQCGTPSYNAPEILLMKEYDSAADLWSLGCVYYEMLTGTTPYRGESNGELYKNIRTKPLVMPADIPLAAETQQLLRELLDMEPSRRTSLEVISHKLACRRQCDRQGQELDDFILVGRGDISNNIVGGLTTLQMLNCAAATELKLVEDRGAEVLQVPVMCATFEALQERARRLGWMKKWDISSFATQQLMPWVGDVYAVLTQCASVLYPMLARRTADLRNYAQMVGSSASALMEQHHQRRKELREDNTDSTDDESVARAAMSESALYDFFLSLAKKLGSLSLLVDSEAVDEQHTGNSVGGAMSPGWVVQNDPGDDRGLAALMNPPVGGAGGQQAVCAGSLQQVAGEAPGEGDTSVPMTPADRQSPQQQRPAREGTQVPLATYMAALHVIFGATVAEGLGDLPGAVALYDTAHRYLRIASQGMCQARDSCISSAAHSSKSYPQPGAAAASFVGSDGSACEEGTWEEVKQISVLECFMQLVAAQKVSCLEKSGTEEEAAGLRMADCAAAVALDRDL